MISAGRYFTSGIAVMPAAKLKTVFVPGARNESGTINIPQRLTFAVVASPRGVFAQRATLFAVLPFGFSAEAVARFTPLPIA